MSERIREWQDEELEDAIQFLEDWYHDEEEDAE